MISMSDTKLGEASIAALWTGFGFMLFSTFVFLGMTLFGKSKKAKLFQYLTTSIVAIAALAYLIMALGRSQMTVEGGREFLWVRYADWAFTTPLLLIDLGLLAGVTFGEIVFLIVMDLIMIAAGFAGAVSPGINATWPLFTFGTVAMVAILYVLIGSFMARASGPAKSTFNTLTLLTAAIWSIYPIIWATGEGGRAQNPDQETICYAVLDIIAKCVFGFILMFSHSALEAAPGVISDSEATATKKEVSV